MPKQEIYIEHEILCYLMQKGVKAIWKNDIKGFYNEKKGFYQRNKSNFIRTWISDISFLYKGKFVCIEVKTQKQMSSFDKTYKELNDKYIKAQISGKSPTTIKKYLHAVEQKKFIDDIIESWWVWFFASSVDQVIERLKFNWINI